MRALALCLEEPKVSLLSKIHFCLYRCHSFICSLYNLSVSPPCSFMLIPSAQTPIEEFTPTPAFPALQYLESVDEGGVAWRAGLRMGDFLIEVKRDAFWTRLNPPLSLMTFSLGVWSLYKLQELQYHSLGLVISAFPATVDQCQKFSGEFGKSGRSKCLHCCPGITCSIPNVILYLYLHIHILYVLCSIYVLLCTGPLVYKVQAAQEARLVILYL